MPSLQKVIIMFNSPLYWNIEFLFFLLIFLKVCFLFYVRIRILIKIFKFNIFADCWFVYRKRGKHTMKCLLDDENFVYALTKKKVNGGANWRCLDQRKKDQKCPATASTYAGKIVYSNGNHNHPSNYDAVHMVICNNPVALDDFWALVNSSQLSKIQYFITNIIKNFDSCWPWLWINQIRWTLSKCRPLLFPVRFVQKSMKGSSRTVTSICVLDDNGYVYSNSYKQQQKSIFGTTRYWNCVFPRCPGKCSTLNKQIKNFTGVHLHGPTFSEETMHLVDPNFD